MTSAASPTFGERALELHPQVALRPEPFGALAYHYGNRRLVFLKHPDVVRVVRLLADHQSVEAAFDAAGIAAARRPSFERALASLLDSEMLRDRAADLLPGAVA
jgi:putative mycofactocin binding protein MftB